MIFPWARAHRGDYSTTAAPGLFVTMTTPQSGPVNYGMAVVVAVMVAAWSWQIMADRVNVRSWFLVLPIPVEAAAYVATSLCILLFNSEAPKTFIYFRFRGSCRARCRMTSRRLWLACPIASPKNFIEFPF
jgi:hypothetical protein